MTLYLQNNHLHLAIHPEQANWDLTPRGSQGLALQGARMSIRYRPAAALGGTRTALSTWPGCQLGEPQTAQSPHGPLQQVTLHSSLYELGLFCSLTFALPEEHPFLLLKVNLANRGTQPIRVDQIEMLNLGFINVRQPSDTRRAITEGASSLGRLQFPTARPDPAFFSNGWQSWSHTGSYGMQDAYRRTRLGPVVSPMWYNASTPQPRRASTFASDMFGVLGDRKSRLALLAGFLSQQQQFGTLEALLNPRAPALRLWASGDGARLDPGAQMETDWACVSFLQVDDPDPLAPYLDAVARQNGIADTAGSSIGAQVPTTGWCSWYHFFQKVTANDIRANLEAAAQLRPSFPIDLIQIDDGFEAQVGDWFDFAPGFPGGPAPLAAEIRQAGFMPGLWLAPFIVHPKSQLYRQHPDWLLRGRFGRPANAGFVWDVFTTGLDLTQPATLEYACQVVRTAAHEWGYPYLKLDFLYAAALPGRYHDPTRTRAQVLRHGLEALRQAVGPDVILLGCGCPLGSAVGVVNAMRIGADVGPRWMPDWHGIESFFKAEPGMPSARNAIQNAITRLPLHRRWWVNDPDCLLLRPETQYTPAELNTLATVIALGDGLILFSDHLPDLPPDRLRLAESLLPPLNLPPHSRPILADWFDTPTPTCLLVDLQGSCGAWRLAAIFNWDDVPQTLELQAGEVGLDPQQEYLGRDFWSGQTFCLPAGQPLALADVPAHGVRLLALRPSQPGQPVYVGSDLHISQGSEVTTWQAGSHGLAMRIERPGKAQGEIVLALPIAPGRASLNGSPLAWTIDQQGFYHFAITFNQSATIEIGG